MKKTILLPFLCSVLVAAVSCNNDTKDTTTTTEDTSKHEVMEQMALPDTSVVPMVSAAEAIIAGTYSDTLVEGTATFNADAKTGKVTMVLALTIPKKANKNVAVHLHEHGDCGDTAKLAHGHWNPTNTQHGKWGEGSFHVGDIGNVKLDGKGKGTVTIETDLWTLGGMPAKNILGKAVIVHGGVDDYTSQPGGNAGTRIGCGTIQGK